MVKRVLELLSACPDGIFVDATVGAGGHLTEVIKTFGNRFKYFGFDLDSLVLRQTRKKIAKLGLEVELINSNFVEIAEHLKRRKIQTLSAVLYDLGIGSFQIDNPERGFSYLADGPLSMSFDNGKNSSAADLINRLSEQELTGLFKQYGQEPKSRSIAKAIKNYPQKIVTTGELAKIIRATVGNRSFVKTASRVFQAIRIKVNNELENIKLSLETVLPMLVPGGMAFTITYHSIEDGYVKRIFKRFSGKCICQSNMLECRCGKQKLIRPVFSKPERPPTDEVAYNIRARSAKLRVVEKIETPS